MCVNGIDEDKMKKKVFIVVMLVGFLGVLSAQNDRSRSEERRVGKECRSRWSPYH